MLRITAEAKELTLISNQDHKLILIASDSNSSVSVPRLLINERPGYEATVSQTQHLQSDCTEICIPGTHGHLASFLIPLPCSLALVNKRVGKETTWYIPMLVV